MPDTPTPLSGLHKMSTTAGVANAQYVAINPLAIVALLFGIASALSLIGSLLLVIPVVGVLFAVVAWRQIDSSSGTQTGKVLAACGGVLCVALGGVVIARQVSEAADARRETRQISGVIDQLGRFVSNGDYEQAFARFTPEFRSRMTEMQFGEHWKSLQQREAFGPIHRIAWNGIIPRFDTIAGGKVPIAMTQVRVDSDRLVEDRFQVTLRKVDGQWLIDNIPTFFPELPGNRK